MLNFNYNIRRFDIAATLGLDGRYENMNTCASHNAVWFENCRLNASRYTPAARCNVWNC